jgi:signal transduction histidine kinase
VFLSALFRTASFRFAIAYAALLAVSVVILLAVVYLATTHLLEQQLRAAIEAELASLVAIFDQGGPAELRAAIGTRAATPRGAASVYLWQDAAGRRLAGDPLPARPVAGWQELVLAGAPADDPDVEATGQRMLARAAFLSDGSLLLVGQDAYEVYELLELLQRSLALTVALAIPLALGGGVLMSALTLRRTEAIARVSAEIRGGDLARRVPRTGRLDEFDRLAAEINAMLDAIQHLTEGLRQVSNDIAHDLRTPLSRLRQELEAARLKAASPDELDAAIERAIAQSDAILDTFGALLRIAQIEAGTRRAGFATVDLSALCRALVEVYEPVAEDAQHALAARIDDGIAVRGDRELLTQLLANLIENALCHTPPGTRLEVALQRAGGSILAVIADDGPGIPEAARDQVFRRFFRLEHSRPLPGSGLGLSLVAAIAALHAIQIDLADNTPGLRVTLRFPDPAPG